MYPLFVNEEHNLQNAVICEEGLGKNDVLFAHLKCKDVERFRNGSVHEFYGLKASQIRKSSH